MTNIYLMISWEGYLSRKNIYFKIEGWDNVHFMKFPTFVVMNLDFTELKATSFKDYERYKLY
jgi:hypothetical protein